MPARYQGLRYDKGRNIFNRVKHFHLGKYLRAASTPGFWPALAKGVMPGVERTEALSCTDVRSVIDVGANKGLFSLMVRSRFPDAEIHAFEPLETEFEIFKSVVAGPVKHYAVALGAESATASFYVASRPDSSSLFKPSKDHERVAGVTVSSSQTIPVVRLNDAVDVRTPAGPVLMKLDVQGGEPDVLKGAVDVLPFVDAIYTEASFVSLYERQPLAGEIIGFLAAHGFALRGVFNPSVELEVGPIQADSLFVRANAEGVPAELHPWKDALADAASARR